MSISEPKKAVAYIRISDRKQIDGESPETQRRAIQEYADRNNIEIVPDGWFFDEAKSGKNTDREDLQKLLLFVARNAKRIDLVLFYKLNRGSRDAMSYYTGIKAILTSKGIGVRSASEPMVDDTPIGRWMEGMFVLNGQLDNEVKGSVTTDNMRSLAIQGYWQHGPIIGYNAHKIPNELGKLRPTLKPSAMAPKVKTVLERFSQADISKAELTRFARSIGLKSPRGKYLTDTSIIRLLANPMYAGFVYDKFTDGELVDGKHQAIISLEIYWLNQRILRAATNKRSGAECRTVRDDYPLKRLLLCHNCLKPLYASAPKTGGGGYSPRYHCARPSCKGKTKSVKAAEVHQRFLTLLQDIEPSKGQLRLYKEILLRQAIKEVGNLNHEITTLRTKLNEIAKARIATNTKFSLNHLSKDERDEVIATLNQEKFNIADELAQREQQQTVQEKAIDYAITFMEHTAQLWKDAAPEHRRRFQNMIFKEGLILNTQTLEFGTPNISPLYRYIPNKKDLSETEKPHLVTPIDPFWNLIRGELVRWYGVLSGIQSELAIPSVA